MTRCGIIRTYPQPLRPGRKTGGIAPQFVGQTSATHTRVMANHCAADALGSGEQLPDLGGGTAIGQNKTINIARWEAQMLRHDAFQYAAAI